MTDCECNEFDHLEMNRKAISARIKKSKKLQNHLEVIVQSEYGRNSLMKCPDCDQFWQGSYAWNWGSRFYVFKVPEIKPEDWIEKQYIEPDKLLIHLAVTLQYLEQNSFIEKAEKCRALDCLNQAIKLSVLCLTHHIESLRKAGALSKKLEGRWFLPYSHFNLDEDFQKYQQRGELK
jgi:hypothetical protein